MPGTPEQTNSNQVPPRPQDPTFLRLAAGTVYFYFGFLKFFPDLSPAELLAGQSIMRLFGYVDIPVDAATALFYLAIFECLIGLCFLLNIFKGWLLVVFLVHQLSTFLPLFMLPEICFKIAPFAPTLEGQYIFKNLISIAAGWTVMLPALRHNWQQARRRQLSPQATDPSESQRTRPRAQTIETKPRSLPALETPPTQLTEIGVTNP